MRWLRCCLWFCSQIKAGNKLCRCVTQDVTQHLWMKNWLTHLVLRNIKNCLITRVGREGVKYVLRDVKTFPNQRGPDQKIKWSAIKQNFSHLKDLDLKDTDTGPVRLIIGSNNSDLILPMQILKPSGQCHADKVPYAVETPLGWAVNNWLPGEQRVASP